MPTDKYANMEEKLWILEDLNMMYIRQIALSLQVKKKKKESNKLFARSTSLVSYWHLLAFLMFYIILVLGISEGVWKNMFVVI